jgi:hypothetical protein
MDLKNQRKILSAFIETKDNSPSAWLEAKTYWGISDQDVNDLSNELDKQLKEELLSEPDT